MAEAKRVMAFGTFDTFHAGHEDYLRQAKAHGDELFVIVARDRTVKQIKKQFPQDNEKARMTNVKKCEHVTKAVLGNHADKYKVLLKYRPSVIALGYDQFTFTYRLAKFLIDHKIDAEIVRLEPYKPNIFKSSLLRKEAHEH